MFGWRTLGEALQSLPGVYTTYDRQYTYLGVRGFGLPGDYVTRLKLTINGNSVNNDVFVTQNFHEFIFDLLWAAALVWLGHHRNIKPPGLFALYVAGYSAFRIFEESLRVDPSEHFLGVG